MTRHSFFLNKELFSLFHAKNKNMEWVVENKMLLKEFEFKNFAEALRFINRVGELAEEMDHHPDILLHSYKKVKIILFTHSKGEITDLDRNLAQKIDQL